MDRTLSLDDLVAAVCSGQTTASELVGQALELATGPQARDLNIFTEVFGDCQKQAADIDRRQQAGKPLGPLGWNPVCRQRQLSSSPKPKRPPPPQFSTTSLLPTLGPVSRGYLMRMPS